MFSLQTMFGQGNQFYTLLEDAAVAAHDSAKALHVMLKGSERQPALDQGPGYRSVLDFLVPFSSRKKD